MTEVDATTDVFRVETPESVAFAYDLAGLGSRGLALILDTVLLALLFIGEGAVFALAGWAAGAVSRPTGERLVPWLVGAALIVWFCTYWGYFIVGEVWRNGRTWGKRRMGIRVVRDDGSRVGAGDAVVRNLLRIIDLLPGNYAVGMFCVLLSKRNKRVGDMAAGTVVVRDAGEDDLVFEGGGVAPRTLLAREFLDRRPSLTPAARMQVGIEVLRALGEESVPNWDEPTLAGRIADLCGWRQLRGVPVPPPPPDAPAADGNGR